MKRVITIYLFCCCMAMCLWATVTLPWDSLFTSRGLSKSMALIPAYISPELDIRYTEGNMAGIWGLTPPVAKRYGLRIDKEVDERYDVRLASMAAAQYLEDLTAYYGNEEVAMLAYLNGAIRLNDVATLHGIDLKNITAEGLELLCQHLPKNAVCDSLESVDFASLNSVYHHTGYKKYSFRHPIRMLTLRDSLNCCDSEFDRQNAAVMPTMRWVREAFINVAIDRDSLENWLETRYESEIVAMNKELEQLALLAENEQKARAVAIKKANAVKIYYVKSGDTLSHIAKRHKVTVRQLKQWNNLKSDFLRVGQKLKIQTS